MRPIFPEAKIAGYPAIDDEEEFLARYTSIWKLYEDHQSVLRTFGARRIQEMGVEQRRLVASNLTGAKLSAFFIVLEDTCKGMFMEDPVGARDLAQESLSLVRELGDALPKGYDIAYLDAIFSAHWGNCLRILGEQRKAIWALHRALRLSEQTPDPLCAAVTLRYLARALADARRPEEALKTSAEARRIYSSVGNEEDLLCQRYFDATVLAQQGNPAEANNILLKIRSETVDSKVVFAVQTHLVKNFLDLGKPWFAQRELLTLKRLPAEGIAAVRVSWLDGLVHEGLDQHDAAYGLLRGVLDHFREAGQAVDAATVSLDVIRLCLRTGKRGEIGTLMKLLLPLFRDGLDKAALDAMKRLLSPSSEVTEKTLQRLRNLLAASGGITPHEAAGLEAQ